MTSKSKHGKENRKRLPPLKQRSAKEGDPIYSAGVVVGGRLLGRARANASKTPRWDALYSEEQAELTSRTSAQAGGFRRERYSIAARPESRRYTSYT